MNKFFSVLLAAAVAVNATAVWAETNANNESGSAKKETVKKQDAKTTKKTDSHSAATKKDTGKTHTSSNVKQQAAPKKEKRVIAKEAAPNDSQDLGAKKLVALLSNLQNMKADFKQLVLDAKGTQVQDVTGKMYVKRPGQFRWDVASPFEQQIISDGSKVYVYDKDLSQVSIRKLDKQVGNTPALLLSGNPDELDKSFDITALSAPMGNAYQFELRPRSKEKLFDVLKVSFRDGVITDMFMQDGLGQRTSIDFLQPQINGDVPASMFSFVAPKGADVIDESK